MKARARGAGYGARLAGAAAVLLAAALAGGSSLPAASAAQRYPRLASKLQCTCGCDTPIMKECETMQCSMKDYINADIVRVETGPMRHEPMSLILQAFEQKYGSRVLLAPPATGFSLVVWIMPIVAVVLGLWLVLFAIRYWRRRAPGGAALLPAGATAAAPPPEDGALARAREQVRAEMERELRREP